MAEINLYSVYGLNIKSEIKIEEFIEVNNGEFVTDVKIVNGIMSDEIKKSIYTDNKHTEISKNNIWFYIKDVAIYSITNGDTITVEACINADMQMLKVYLMCSCLGFIMFQRDMVAIHGGTSCINGNGIIITGDRGAGKSTLTTSLSQKGYPFIADDVAAIYIDKIPFIYPGFPYQKLCEDAMEKLGYYKSNYSSFISDEKIKYMVPAHQDFIDYSVPLTTIFELVAGVVDDVTINEVKGSEKIAKIIKNIYRGEYIDLMGGMIPKYFKQCLNIAQNIKFYKITRPKDGFTVDSQIKLIEETLNTYKEEKAV